MTRQFTGRHMAMVLVAFFGVVITVNLIMARFAISTFGGVVVENSYVASQTFDKDMAAQKALGWTLDYGYSRGHMTLAFRDAAGRPVAVQGLTALVGRVTETAQDQTPNFTLAEGVYTAPVTLDGGRWMIMVEAKANDGTRFHQRLSLVVKG